MGYWHPPPPSVFNPWPRPLRWHPEGDGPYPEPEDEKFYGANRNTAKTPPVNVQVGPNEYAWIYPPGLPENTWDDTKGPWKNYGDLVCVGGYGAGFNYNDKSPAQRLDYYRKMIALRVPPMGLYGLDAGDPPSGGLCADMATEGAVFIHYFDCSDSDKPRRKVIIYYTDGKTDPEVKEWNGSEWSGEGFDWDKDLPKLFSGALQVIQAAGTAALAYFTANPAAIGAFQGMMKNMIASAAPGGHIDPGATLQAAFGPAIADKSFQAAMISDIKKNALLGSLYTETAQIKAAADEAANSGTSILSAFKGAIDKYKDVIPKISMQDVAVLTQGQIPVSIAGLTWQGYQPGGPLYGQPIPKELAAKKTGQPGLVVDAIKKATVAWANRYDPDGETIHFSYRKLFNLGSTVGVDASMPLSWRDSFDSTYASLQASEVSIHAPRTISTVDPLSLPLETQLANLVHTIALFKSKNDPSLASLIARMQTQANQLQQQINSRPKVTATPLNPIQVLLSLIASLKQRYGLT